MEFLALTLYLLARLTPTLILASAIYWLFLKGQFLEGNYLSYMKLCCCLNVRMSHTSRSKNRLFYVEISAL